MNFMRTVSWNPQGPSVDMIDQRLVGEVEDIDSDGFLILRDNRGKSHRIISGDVTLR